MRGNMGVATRRMNSTGISLPRDNPVDLHHLLRQEPKALLVKSLMDCQGLDPRRRIASDSRANPGIEELFPMILNAKIFSPSRTRKLNFIGLLRPGFFAPGPRISLLPCLSAEEGRRDKSTQESGRWKIE